MSVSTDLEPIHQLTAEEKEKLARAPGLNEFQRQKLEKESKKNWDLFYKRNGNRFFKNRYWTRHEFHELFVGADYCGNKEEDTGSRELTKLLEIGCGCGDFVLPLLEATEQQSLDLSDRSDDRSRPRSLFIYCCDISDKAIEILKENPIYKKHSPAKIKAFPCDITKTEDFNQLLLELNDQRIDIVSMIFVLSALDPSKMRDGISNIHKVLKPGGQILFRDYAIYDKAMLRFSEKSKICEQFYARQDGTRSYFFSKEQLLEMFESCSFHCQSIDYVRRETVNNATKDRFSRIFLQAKFASSTTTA